MQVISSETRLGINRTVRCQNFPAEDVEEDPLNWSPAVSNLEMAKQWVSPRRRQSSGPPRPGSLQDWLLKPTPLHKDSITGGLMPYPWLHNN